MVRSFLAFFGSGSASLADRLCRLDPSTSFEIRSSHDGLLTVAVPYRRKGFPGEEDNGRAVVLVLGDDAERERILRGECVANAAQIRCDYRAAIVEIATSIVGLPAIFLYRDAKCIALASAPHLLTAVPGVSLAFQPDALVESCVIGHPIGCKSLFKNLSIVPGGRRVTASRHGVALSVGWSAETTRTDDARENPINRQRDAFRDAVRRTDLDATFLSMTAGVDTRAILAMLVEQEKTHVPAYTMTGTRINVDAKRARALCEHYGISHSTVRFGREFLQSLPTYTVQASLLTGGLASLDQAHEVYFYRTLSGSYTGRLCGYLGNQVGRRGTEGIAMRRASTVVIHHDVLQQAAGIGKRDAHWCLAAPWDNGYLDSDFLLRQQVLWASVANYTLGQNFAVQKSPYADTTLIALSCGGTDVNMHRIGGGIWRLRVRDLKHRMIGEQHGFQPDLIKEVGGYLAEAPINWSWRGCRGISGSGMVDGTLAFLDEATCALQPGPKLRRLLAVTGIAGRSTFNDRAAWLRRLASFIGDTFHSSAVQECGVLDRQSLIRVYNLWRSGTRGLDNTITFALDIALASQVFRVIS